MRAAFCSVSFCMASAVCVVMNVQRFGLFWSEKQIVLLDVFCVLIFVPSVGLYVC